MSEDPLKDCPECDESSLRKLVSAAAFKLKGTGWYETDFKDNASKKPDAKASSTPVDKKAEKTDPANKPEPKKETKTEKKPASPS